MANVEIVCVLCCVPVNICYLKTNDTPLMKFFFFVIQPPEMKKRKADEDDEEFSIEKVRVLTVNVSSLTQVLNHSSPLVHSSVMHRVSNQSLSSFC